VFVICNFDKGLQRFPKVWLFSILVIFRWAEGFRISPKMASRLPKITKKTFRSFPRIRVKTQEMGFFLSFFFFFSKTIVNVVARTPGSLTLITAPVMGPVMYREYRTYRHFNHSWHPIHKGWTWKTATLQLLPTFPTPMAASVRAPFVMLQACVANNTSFEPTNRLRSKVRRDHSAFSVRRKIAKHNSQ